MATTDAVQVAADAEMKKIIEEAAVVEVTVKEKKPPLLDNKKKIKKNREQFMSIIEAICLTEDEDQNFN